MNRDLIVEEQADAVLVKGRHFYFGWNRESGKLTQIAFFDGISWHDNLLAEGGYAGLNWDLPLVEIEAEKADAELVLINTTHESAEWRIVCKYEVYKRGYVICTFALTAKVEGACGEALHAGMALDRKTVFSHDNQIKYIDSDPDSPYYCRAISVDFSTDARPVSNSVDFLLESVTCGMKNRDNVKISEAQENTQFLGWKLTSGSPWYPYPEGFHYENRWCLTLTALDNSPNRGRCQRIYTFIGMHPRYPSAELLEEMAEYGCSVLHLHNWGKHISGEEPADEAAFKTTVEYAKKLGMKVVFYCQPYLISVKARNFREYSDCRTQGINMWNSGYSASAKDNSATQIVSYTPFSDWNCDELCLRDEKAYRFIHDSIINTWRKYDFDGIYMDFAWPAQELCSNVKHGHQAGLFNFYDYLRLLRDLRTAIGPEQIMIGHGGGFFAGSDFVEAFDVCLTGEAQNEMSPAVIGRQYGTAPALWTCQRRKKDEFRSHPAIESAIREGLTPFNTVGVCGTAVNANLDPAHHPELIALWQMWRAFPVDKADFYNHLTESVIELDNPEILYSVFVTPEKQVLLLVVNPGGPMARKSATVSVNVRLDRKKLGLPEIMNCWRMKGNNYETFRIASVEPVCDGIIPIPEINIHEFIGFVLSPGLPPLELTWLCDHLEGRWQRLPRLLAAKQQRLLETDRMLDYFATLPNAKSQVDYAAFMKRRVAE